jgi:hypothetical protein
MLANLNCVVRRKRAGGLADAGDFTAGSGKYYAFTGIQLKNPKGAPETTDSDALENLEEIKAGGKQ